MKGLTKLNNLGNTCYMNSVVQCLSHLPEFNEWCDTSKKDSILFKEYNDLRKLLWEGHEGISPGRFVNILHKQLPLERFWQHDAHELFLYLLDDFQCPLFQGIQVSHIDTTTKEETFLSLELPVRPSLEESWNAYLEPEMVEWNGKQVQKKIEIKEYPALLLISFKRFTNQNNKLDSIITIQPFLNYELIAICNHMGNTRSGHYTATVKMNQWYECNDDQIYPSSITNHAYCLLFRKKTS
jgi:ubiquitin C-terminal hydrolase